MAAALHLFLLPLAVLGEESPDFAAYARRFGLAFPKAELAMRQELYRKQLSAIAAQNAQENRLWTAGLNELTVSTEEELHSMMGYNKAMRGGQAPSAPLKAASLRGAQPDSFDWRDQRPNVVTAVKSQGSCGSCWAFAAAATLESHVAIATGVLFDVSPQQLNSCTPNPARCGGAGGCTGATAQLAFNYSAHSGVNTQWNYPYDSGITRRTGECKRGDNAAEWKYGVRVAGITGYVQLPQNDAKALLAAVLQGPVSVSVAASSWYLYESGIFDKCSKTRPILNHAVVLMGYGKEETKAQGKVHFWSLRNSWGSTWGEHGYIRLRRYPEAEPCGVDDLPLYGYACADSAPANITACGECGILSDSAYPVGAFLGSPSAPEDPALGGATFLP